MKQPAHTVWKLLGRHKPRRCPCCEESKSITYVGFVPNYEPGINARMYHCNACGAWMDCIWPKDYAGEMRDQVARASV